MFKFYDTRKSDFVGILKSKNTDNLLRHYLIIQFISEVKIILYILINWYFTKEMTENKSLSEN